jgi:L-lactate dehydrogenase complex protein LldE
MAHKKKFAAPPRRVALFVTCMVDMLYPEVGMAAVELLERQGIEVVFPEEQTCCGQPAFNAGYRDEAIVLARRFVDIFEPLVRSGRVDAVVAPSGSCVTMTTHFYDLLFADQDDTGYRARTATLAAATFELTEFLVDVLGVTDVGARFPGKVTYHACCHLLRELGIDRQPHALLDAVAEAEQVPLTGADECCGFRRPLCRQERGHQHGDGAAQDPRHRRQRRRRGGPVRRELHDPHQRAALAPGAARPRRPHRPTAGQRSHRAAAAGGTGTGSCRAAAAVAG